MYRHVFPSPIGDITAVFDGEFLIGLSLVGQKHIINSADMPEISESPEVSAVGKWLSIYFDGKLPERTPKLRFIGTEFRVMVWETLLDIPYGKTVSYKTLSEMAERKFGRKFFPRAVGGAVGHNPISIIVPCHRVVGRDGTLTGFDGGVEMKQYLLNIENKR